MAKFLVTGGAGFIGTNLVEHCLAAGHQVVAFDNLWRPGGGAKANCDYLLQRYGDDDNFRFVLGDIRDTDALRNELAGVDRVYHVAAQTAMTTSIEDPLEDFSINAQGTLSVLEAVRGADADPIMVYTSTNKVFGDLTKRPVALKEEASRWVFASDEYAAGINQDYPLDFEGPYGCSKGVGDAYCLDYARTFGLRVVVFRMSGIYGTSQRPTEDQGWVAWLTRQALLGQPITIYGDGKQVRDILFVDDLVRAFDLACEHIETTRGQAYTIGGGPANSISLLELLALLAESFQIEPASIGYQDWRRADQKVYISDVSKAHRDFGWRPEISKQEGVARLYRWLAQQT